ncbi:MAG: macro domain-containing protein [Proteobacteria bacterium]|nr:macro domain-containing protein [Pseudomonadota bacterium]
MNIEKGDLIVLTLEGRFDVIVHGCNCFCSMGGGIARAIQEKFPEAYSADLATIKGDQKKLGSFSFATINRNGREVTIVNGYTQFQYHGANVLVDYDAVRKLFANIKREFSGKRIGYPKIGAGLAGGDWQIIASIIDEELTGEDHSVVLYSP